LPACATAKHNIPNLQLLTLPDFPCTWPLPCFLVQRYTRGIRNMHWLLYLRLFTLTASTLLPFFWMVVILGHRRQRNLERIFFFLCLALTCFFGTSLLALNAQLFYATPPDILLRFAWVFLCLGLWFTPPLVVHLHVEYAALRDLFSSTQSKQIWLALAWFPAVILLPFLVGAIRRGTGFDFDRPTHLLGLPFQIFLVASMANACYWQHRFLQAAPDREQKTFHRALEVLLIAALSTQIIISQSYAPAAAAESSALLLILVLLTLGILIGNERRFNFLSIGRQRNLIYAVFGVFTALLYLSFVRRASQWLEPYIPPEATAALLLFLPVVFFEPLQRSIRGLLHQTAQREVDRAHKLMGPINEVARLGDLAKLVDFIERWIAERLQLAVVKLEMQLPNSPIPIPSSHSERSLRSEESLFASPELTAKSSSEEAFSIARTRQYLGQLRVRSHGAMISGETYAALEFLAEQLPATFDLCRLIEEKLQLERELAERERMALIGQMAASISHNLKNPLGSIKTILQVQMESPEMPPSLRGEMQMVLDEVNRLSARLNQLLQFSRGVRTATKREHCNIVSVTTNVVEVLRHEATPGGISLELMNSNVTCEVAASGEALNDILSNVVLNAIEAASRGGHVRLNLHSENASCTVAIEDDGPGISPTIKDKILTPFFSTKARGTGLGLAIVSRRLEEIGGQLLIDSPIREQRGSRFRVILPLAPKENAP
jgi:signal transduction histidine kinase